MRPGVSLEAIEALYRERAADRKYSSAAMSRNWSDSTQGGLGAALWVTSSGDIPAHWRRRREHPLSVFLCGCSSVASFETLPGWRTGGCGGADLERRPAILGPSCARDRCWRHARWSGCNRVRPGGRLGGRRLPELTGRGRSGRSEIVSAGGAACAAQLDVTDQDSVDRFVARADESYGRVDVLVNTAGRLDEADTVRFESMTAQAATALLMVDVIGTMRMCHAVIPFMRRHGRGAIINFSSTYGNGVTAENPINWVPVTYCAAKGAIRGFTASLARDIAPEIRVNALAPGPISGNWEQEWGSARNTSKRPRR